MNKGSNFKFEVKFDLNETDVSVDFTWGTSQKKPHLTLDKKLAARICNETALFDKMFFLHTFLFLRQAHSKSQSRIRSMQTSSGRTFAVEHCGVSVGVASRIPEGASSHTCQPRDYKTGSANTKCRRTRKRRRRVSPLGDTYSIKHQHKFMFQSSEN